MITLEIFDLPCDWKVSSLLAKNLFSHFPENVWLHRSAIECLVQLNIFLCRAAISKPYQESFPVRPCLKVEREKSKRAVQSSIKKKKFYSQFRKDTSVRKCFKKTVPILHSIAASYKLWILRWRCSVKAILGLCLSIYFYFTPPPPTPLCNR